MTVQQTPIISDAPAAQQYKKNLEQYTTSYKGGFPSYGLSGSYMSADLAIQGLIDAGQLREFVFANAVEFWTATNPDFFKGTAVEHAAHQCLQP